MRDLGPRLVRLVLLAPLVLLVPLALLAALVKLATTTADTLMDLTTTPAART